ncbi:MAG: hypothetical protein K6E17_09415 [Clostridiales bacterium]|nr:hypothetical protein [Clostridiales bacterium]
MQTQRSIQQYRAIDLTLFAVILTVFETVLIQAGTKWFPQEAWMVSVTPVITAIVMMRWGPWAAIHAVLGGAALCFLTGAAQTNPRMIPVYCIGNLGGMAGLILLKKAGSEKIRGNAVQSMLFGGVVLLGMLAGRALVSLIVIRDFGALIMYFTPEAVTLLFTLVLMWVVRRPDGLFEDQKHYLKRLNRQADNPGEPEDEGGLR